MQERNAFQNSKNLDQQAQWGGLTVALGKIKVLIADDNREFCELLHTYISGQPDMEVTGVAYHGAEVLSEVEKNVPDIILLDNIMPYLDGVGVLERLNEMELPVRPRVIFLTILGQESITQRVFEMGADYYVLKPFDLDVLAMRMRQLVGLQKQEAGADPPLTDRGTVHALLPPKGMEHEVISFLNELGTPANLKGTRYLREAIVMVIQRVELLGRMTKELYPNIARSHQTTAPRVERAIRYAIEELWKRGNAALLSELFGHTVGRVRPKPTNSEFIAIIADKLRFYKSGT